MTDALVYSCAIIGVLAVLLGILYVFARLMSSFTPKPAPSPTPQPNAAAAEPVSDDLPAARRVLVDTSVIIDGRIADIAAAGFAPGVLMVPRFVLAELQNIADSDDAMRRGRGRRGLEVLNRLREMPDVTVEITEEDAPNIREVDAKLVALAQRLHGNVLTTDYNLNRVAQIQGVRVLNVNELSNAIRPVVLPGEELVVRVVQPGKERNQGVGYLADGTMIVVENGDKLIGQEVATEVTRVFQTVAGKMIFAAPRKAVAFANTPAPKPAQPASPAADKSVTSEAAGVRPTISKHPSGRNHGGRRQPQPTQSAVVDTSKPAEQPGTPIPDVSAITPPAQPTVAPARPHRSRDNASRRPKPSSSSAIEDRLVRGNQPESPAPQIQPSRDHTAERQ